MSAFPSLKAAGAVALAAALLAAPLGAASAETLRIAGNFAAAHSSSKAMEGFAADLKQRTNGALEADLFPGMQLGSARENVDAVRAGTIFGTWIGPGFLSRLVPEIEAVSLPFVFNDSATAFRVIDGPVGDKLNEKMADKGFLVLGWMELGLRNVTNSKRPISSADDLKGLKLRMQPNETHLATFRALGASPISMDVKELYSALQQGVVDGQENPYSIIAANRYFEVQKYLSNTGHFFDFIVVVVNKKQFDALSPANKAALTAAVKGAVTAQRAASAGEQAAALKELQAKGMEYTVLTPEALAVFRERTSGIVDEVKKRAGPELVDLVLKEAKAQ
ncbi:TRAP transporter substrate-binding protein [Aquabacter spiritensis]|uniref:Tripartite ATP-independent transporter DctP family solute receptor n=1 Tax=Aquabacter spiritensis TaxID=933073 RepID=A0A4R3LYW1_9HYPH|nr:TRAP transporter substrate-binding protein [Aquabacter spiritensis]TCT03907.1 tripartite ATP-independent transporter DctP family solute receptor [Aquabacter spiritensis]